MVTEEIDDAVIDKRIQIRRIEISPDIVEKRLEGCREYELWFAPATSSVHRDGEPDFGAVVMLRSVSGKVSGLNLAPIVMESDEPFAIGQLEKHRWRIGMNQRSGFWIRARFAIILAP